MYIFCRLRQLSFDLVILTVSPQNRWPNTTEPQPGAEGVGTEKAVAGYAKWVRERATPGYCASFGYPEWTEIGRAHV